MPAVTTDPLALPRVDAPPVATTDWREPTRTVTARRALEGEGFEVRRPFPGVISLHEADPFLLLDHMGGREVQPYEAKGAPDHPHRGFETVTYMLDGELEHRDSTGGGGVIHGGDTQWMTAGAGLVHSELPTHQFYVRGGAMEGVQLWVNLPKDSKLVTPRYQDLTGDTLTLLSSHDGASLIRLIAGRLGEHEGPGVTHTPVTYAHASVFPGAELRVPWRADFNAMIYALAGTGEVGTEGLALQEGQLAMLGPGEGLRLRSAERQPTNVRALEVLLLGGQPIREPIFHYGPFVMNTKAEILTALEDYRSGKLGTIPPKPDPTGADGDHTA